jgi:hypothetical protein
MLLFPDEKYILDLLLTKKDKNSNEGESENYFLEILNSMGMFET